MNSHFVSGEVIQGNVKVYKDIYKDTILLLERLPEEVWLHILDGIWDPETLFNLSEAALFWRRLLHPRRTDYLLPQVLQVLATANNPISHILGNELLKWRCVSKSWKSAVNKLLEKCHDVDLQTFGKHEFVPTSFLCFPSFFYLYKRSKLDLVKKELQQQTTVQKSDEYLQRNLLFSSTSNIFPARHLIIEEKYIKGLCITVKYFLEIVGHHFWHATFSFTRHFGSFYNVIYDHVTMLPNLMSLEVCYPCHDTSKYHSHSLVKKGAFPTLGNLRMLKGLNIICTCARYQLDAILWANPQINVLVLSGSNWASFEWPPLIYLHTLSVRFKDGTVQLQLPQLPSLRMLRLGFPKQNSLNYSTIWSNIELYRETLTEFCLSFPCTCAPGTLKNRFLSAVLGHKNRFINSAKPLDLPNVKTLELSISSCCSIDFLLGLQSLECLRLCIVECNENLLLHRSEGAGTAAKCNVLQIHTNPLESKIWQLVPSLRILELETNYWIEGSFLRGVYRRENVPTKNDNNVKTCPEILS